MKVTMQDLLVLAGGLRPRPPEWLTRQRGALVAAGCVVVTVIVVACLAAVLRELWWLAEGEVRWVMYRGGPVLNMVAGPAAAVAACWVVRPHQRGFAAGVGVASFVGGAVWYGTGEVSRLAAHAGQMPAWLLLEYVDPAVTCGFAGGLLCITGIACLAIQPSAAELERRDPLGGARWMTMEEAREVFPDDGDIVVGEAYRPDQDRVGRVAFAPRDRSTWGKGGTSKLLTFKSDFDSGHTIFVAGSGGFKTTSTVVPTALRYGGSMVVLDPAGEVGQQVGPQRVTMGRKVILLDPTVEFADARARPGFDVLAPLKRLEDDEGNVLREVDAAGVAAFATLLMPEGSKQEGGSADFFKAMTHNLLTGMLLHVLTAPEFGNTRTLREVRTLASMPETDLRKVIRKVVEKKGTLSLLKETWGAFVSMADQTWTGVAAGAAKDTQWLSLPEYAGLVCGRAFRAEDLPGGQVDVFLQIPGEMLKTYPGVGRVIVGSLMRAMIKANGTHKRNVLFCLDEVDLLGYMNLLEEGRDRGRKYGVSLMLLYQSVGQIEKHFGKEGATAWFESVSFTSFAAIKGMETAEAVSRRCGEKTVVVTNESRAAGLKGLFDTKNLSQATQKRALILPHEITQSLRADEQIIIVRGKPPLRCGRAIFFRREEMTDLLADSNFTKKAKAA